MNKLEKNNISIEIKDLVVDYGETLALDKINLQINNGELVTLLGPSGCGKSTTLNAIAGLITSTSGKIKFFDKNVTKLSPKERNIGLVFQSYALYPHMTVYDNIAFPLRSNKQFQDEFFSYNNSIEEKVEEFIFTSSGGNIETFEEYKGDIEEWKRVSKEYSNDIETINSKLKDAILTLNESLTLAKLHSDAKQKIASEKALNSLDKIKTWKKDNNLLIKTINKQLLINKDDKELILKKEDLIKKNQELTNKHKDVISNYKNEIKQIKNNWKIEKPKLKGQVATDIKNEKQIANDLLIQYSEKYKNEIKNLEDKKTFAENEIKNQKKKFINDEESKKIISEIRSQKKNFEFEVDRLVREVVEVVGITKNLKKKPGQLSGGQQQRVAISRALVRKPGILLLDEPLSNLDAKTRLTTRTWIRQLQLSLGVTTVFVTHDQEEAMSISDRIVCMSNGKIQQVSSPLDMYENPANKFVATFLGMPQMNVFEKDSKIKKAIIKEIKIKGENDFGVRPEHLIINSSSSKNTQFEIKGEVILKEDRGRDLVLTIKYGEEEIQAFSDDRNINVGDNVKVSVMKNSLFVFDEKTGQTKEKI